MAIKDILLPLVGEPSPAAIAAIEKCIALAVDVGARITAVAIELDVGVAVRPHVMISGATEAAEALANVTGLVAAFEAATVRLGARSVHAIQRLPQRDVAAYFARTARLADLTLLPSRPHHANLESLVERLIFESGRPIILCPENLADGLVSNVKHIAIAWDHSAPAARAIADAIPLLQAAATVRIFTVTDAETAAERESGAAMVTHLALHGVTASFEIVKRGSGPVGKVFATQVKAHAIDLLVMGAYHHSRLNEWVWGGASNSILNEPPCWVLMSH
ncbi:universal stress protein [Tardiphaga sp. vice352]|uniref:universal stress protein n=1 Tax=unclassified Tardiphaga TaxID=2631404 RepID=UPI00116225CC|nr:MULTISPECIES: universal stress protein [unclassified Tardiphaga]QDM15086.1 universal stress protein [Tardiphaga sp. vice278]QDM20198.1 universal stress protein [Tardiphaga sp. vice154]QDM25276.1 universal stress protein [Tardiphaga sp. vice304]QDM30483.1 universal stress protein [Tardiphaga sp. vice352]